MQEIADNLSIRELLWAEDIEAAKRLRFIVWQAEGVIFREQELEQQAIADHHDDHGIHWGAFNGTELIGAARLCLHAQLADAPASELFTGLDLPSPVASMNRLVVSRAFRGRQIARAFDEVRIERSLALSAKTVLVTPFSSASRKSSLESLGFTFVPGVTSHALWSPTVTILACYNIFSE